MGMTQKCLIADATAEIMKIVSAEHDGERLRVTVAAARDGGAAAHCSRAPVAAHVDAAAADASTSAREDSVLTGWGAGLGRTTFLRVDAIIADSRARGFVRPWSGQVVFNLGEAVCARAKALARPRGWA